MSVRLNSEKATSLPPEKRLDEPPGRSSPLLHHPTDRLHQVALVDEWLAQLSERQRGVIERRYGLNGMDIATLDAIAQDMALTRERVRQIQMEGLDRLRKIVKRGNISRDSLL